MDYLAWPDYLILTAFLAISVVIGVYHSLTGGRQKTTTEFIMADRALKVLPTAVSLLASFQSAIKILSATSEMYQYGVQYLLMSSIGYVIAIFLSVHVAVPWMFRLQPVSINEYFERRFKSKAIRILAAVISIFSGILYMGTAMYAPSAALESVTGLRVMVSVPIMAVVCITYTALGGMRAVIWTDVFQCAIMFGGMLAVVIKGLVVVGGFESLFGLCSQQGRLIWADWNPDPTVRHTVWGFIFGFSMTWFQIYGFSQASVQRFTAVKSLQRAKMSLLINMPPYLILNFMACLAGLIVVAYYSALRCDPLTNRTVRNGNQLLAYFVVEVFADSPGFAGLFLATLYGGALSSVSSSLSGASANCWEDILQWKLSHWTESRKALVNRGLVIIFGLSATGVAFLVSTTTVPISQIGISLSGVVMGPLFGLFILGGLFRRANWKGALVGGITGLLLGVWVITGAFFLQAKSPTLPTLGVDGCVTTLRPTVNSSIDITTTTAFDGLVELSNATSSFYSPASNKVPLTGLQKLYSISYIWYSLIWMLVTVVVGLVASLILRDRSKEEEDIDPELLLDLKAIFLCRGDSKPTDSYDKTEEKETFSVKLHDGSKNGLKKEDRETDL